MKSWIDPVFVIGGGGGMGGRHIIKKCIRGPNFNIRRRPTYI